MAEKLVQRLKYKEQLMKMSMYQLEYTFLRFLSVEKRSCMLNIIHVIFLKNRVLQIYILYLQSECGELALRVSVNPYTFRQPLRMPCLLNCGCFLSWRPGVSWDTPKWHGVRLVHRFFFKPDHWFDSLMYRSCFSYHSGKLYENMIKALCFCVP